MFSKMGAFGTFGAFFVGGGKNEILHLALLIDHETLPIISSMHAEIIGRVLSFLLQSLLAIVYGGVLVGLLQSGTHSEAPTTRRICSILYLAWWGLILLAVKLDDRTLWREVSFTRRCVYFVGNVYPNKSV